MTGAHTARRAALPTLTAAAGVLIALVALLAGGVSVGGSVCGGAGDEQRCLQVDRTLSVATDLGWFSAAALALAAALACLGLAGVAWPRARLWTAAATAAVALAGMVGAEHVDSRFCPGAGVGTCGRADAGWGPVLRGPLLELRAEQRGLHVGRPVVPGGPAAERGQSLETFRAAPLRGWTWLRRLVVAAWLLALAQLAALLVRPRWAAPVAVATLGGSVWAGVYDRMHPCQEEGSDCFHGVLTALALIASAVVWALALAAARVAARSRRPR